MKSTVFFCHFFFDLVFGETQKQDLIAKKSSYIECMEVYEFVVALVEGEGHKG